MIKPRLISTLAPRVLLPCLLSLATAGCSSGGSTGLTEAEKAQVQKGPVDFKSLPEDQKNTIKEKMAAAMSGAPKPGTPPAHNP